MREEKWAGARQKTGLGKKRDSMRQKTGLIRYPCGSISMSETSSTGASTCRVAAERRTLRSIYPLHVPPDAESMRRLIPARLRSRPRLLPHTVPIALLCGHGDVYDLSQERQRPDQSPLDTPAPGKESRTETENETGSISWLIIETPPSPRREWGTRHPASMTQGAGC